MLRKSWVYAIVAVLICLLTVAAGISVSENIATAVGADYSLYSTISDFVINTQEDFDSFSTTYSGSSRNFANKKIILNCDIDLCDAEFILNSFCGEFVGNGHIINNISSPMFDTVGSRTYTQTLIRDLEISGKNTLSYVFASKNYGTIKNVSFFGEYTVVKEDYASVFSGVIRTNYGGLENVRNFANIAGGKNAVVSGISETNYGTLLKCVFAGDIAINVVSGGNSDVALLTRNNLILDTTILPNVASTGSVDKCAVIANVSYNETETSAIKPYIYAVTVNNGSISNCSVVADTSYYMPTSSIDKGVSRTMGEGSTISFSYFIYDDVVSGYKSDGTAFSVSDDWRTDLISENIGSDFYFYTDIYPVPKHVYNVDGITAESAVSVKNKTDLFSLRFLSGGDSIYVLQIADIDVSSVSMISGFADVIINGTYDGCFYALYGTENIAVFDNNFAFTFDNVCVLATTTAVSLAEGRMDGVGIYSDGVYNYGFDESETPTTVTADNTFSGNGTAASPFLIATAQNLKALDGISGYALLVSDITVNTNDGTNRLNIENLSVTLYGGGHSIIGLVNEPLCSTLTGTVRDVFIRGFGANNSAGLICVDNYGTVNNVTVSLLSSGLSDVAGMVGQNYAMIKNCKFFGNITAGTAAGVALDNIGIIEKVKSYACIDGGSGITAINNNSVKLCQSYGESDYGVTAEQNGTVQNTVVFGSVAFANVVTGISSSILQTESGYKLLDGGVERSFDKLDYFTMKEYSAYNMAEVYGYENNTSFDYPVLREKGKIYKTEITNPFRTYGFETKTYSTEVGYSVEDIELYTVTAATLASTHVWKYNNELFNGSDLQNAGVYVLTTTYLGSNTYLPSVFEQTFTILKANEPLSLVYENYEDIDLSYNGGAAEFLTLMPSNLAAAEGYGYVYTVKYTKSGTVFEKTDIIDVGVYTETITFTSQNYIDIVNVRTITINKVDLYFTVGNADTDYNAAVDFSSMTFTVNSGRLVIDAEKTFADIIGENCLTYVTTDYEIGDNVGEYDISFSLAETDYYILHVTDGILTVNAIPLTQGEISFYNAISGRNGTATFDYTGDVIALVAENVPNGVSVTYENNESIAAGTYYPTATFSKDNYIDLVLVVYFRIRKIGLTLTVNSLTKDFGYSVDENFTVSVDGLVENDEANTVFLGKTFTYSVFDGETEKDIGTVLSSGSYTVKLSVNVTAENPLTNYNIDNIVFGTLSVNKISLTALYTNNDDNANKAFDNVSTVYDGNAVSKTLTYFIENDYTADIVYRYYKGETLLAGNFVTSAGTYTVKAIVTPTGELATNYVETEYICSIFIDKKPLTIAFAKTDYEFPYISESYADKKYYNYTGSLPTGIIPVLSVTKGALVSDAKDVGTYTVKYTVSEIENYYGCTATAELTIIAAAIELSLKTSYEFSAATISMEITAFSGVYNDEVDLNDVSFTYKNSYATTISAITAVGNYTVAPSIANTNYYIRQTSFAVTVTKHDVYFEWGTLEYTYGDLGDIAYGGKNFVVTASKITLKNYAVSGLNVNIDIGVNFDEAVAGTYILEEESLIQPVNYSLHFTETSKQQRNNKVIIKKCNLAVVWLVDGVEYYEQNYSTSYSGVSQNGRYSYLLTNFVTDDDIPEIDINQQIVGTGSDIYSIGDYTVILTLLNNTKYELSNKTFGVEIVKAPLYITVNDAEVEEGESYNYPSMTITGRMGDDRNKGIESLMGADVRIITDYTNTAPVGSRFAVSVSASFHNYTTEIMKTGVVTVIENTYPGDYILKNTTFVYDGTAKSVTIVGLPDALNVAYSNNVHTNAGVYSASAVVTYPSGRTKTSTCQITVFKATPTVEILPKHMVYKENLLLVSSDIIATAEYKGNDVDGNFDFSEETYLRLGEYKEYSITFTPNDTENYNTVNTVYTIASVEINMMSFDIDKPSMFTFTAQGEAEITGEVRLTLKSVLENLTLYRDVSLVEGIILNKTEKLTIVVRYSGEVCFSQELSVVLIQSSEDEPKVIDEKIFKLDSISFTDKGLSVLPLGGRIALDDKYKNDYALYVNGVMVEEYILNGNEGTVFISVKSKTSSAVTVFSQEYVVSTATIENTSTGKDYTIYYIVGGCVLFVGLGIAVFFIIRNRRLGK